MSKFVWSVIAFVVIAYFVRSIIEENETREQERQQEARLLEAFQQNVSEFVENHQAIDTWQASLAGRGLLDTILTIDLEREWLQKRPISFHGKIQDIATFSDTSYLVTLGQDFLLGGLEYYSFVTDLQLSLVASKQLIDNFLSENPDAVQGVSFDNGVLVIANIRKISTEYALGEDRIDGVRKEIRIGAGELVDIMFTGNNRL